MSKTPKYDAKVKAILDGLTPGERVCELTGEKWEMTQDFIDRFISYNVPPITLSPVSYLRTQLILHTAFSWWWNTDAETGKPIITNVHPHTEFKVVADEIWHDRDYASINHGVDSSQSFFDQFYNLAIEVPFSAQKNFVKPKNSIARHSFGDEDSYFMEGSISKRCLYSSDGFNMEDCIETCYSSYTQNCYNLLHCNKMNHCRVARESRDCINCDFIFDLRNCENCFMSWNKRHKKYLFMNEQLTKEDWDKRVSEIDLGDHHVFEKYYQEFHEAVGGQAVWPENFNEHCNDSTGEYLEKCVRCTRAWYGDRATDCRWVYWDNMTAENNMLGANPNSTDCFGCPAAVNSSKCRYCYFVNHSIECEYCIECHYCENCFGCVQLRHKKFHIFNKQYSEEGYWAKVDEIKSAMLDRGEYGQSLPSKFSLTPFEHSAYKAMFIETPELTKQLKAIEFDNSLDGAYGDWEGKAMHEINEIPLHIKDVGDEWVGRAIMDQEYDRPFSIHPAELKFYRKENLPVRREHFIKRVEDLWFSLNLFEQFETKCSACGMSVTASMNRRHPNRKIYCRECYLKYLEQHG